MSFPIHAVRMVPEYIVFTIRGQNIFESCDEKNSIPQDYYS